MNWQDLLKPEFIGLGFILIFLLLIWVYAIILSAKRPETTDSIHNLPSHVRIIPAFEQLKHTIRQSVEEGQRLHISLGDGLLHGLEAASALSGLAMLSRIGRTAAASDRPPVATSGDGLLAILSQDTQHCTYQQLGASHLYSPLTGQISGLTPWSYAVGAIPVIYDQNITANILAGHFGGEIALITDASERNKSQLFAGSDSLPAQAILYAAAHEQLVGEDLYAGGAYLNAGRLHIASLIAQDILRWALILLILAGVVLKLIGKL